jgi:hypothetical protein
MAFDRLPPDLGGLDPEAVQIERLEMFRTWRRRLSRKAGRRISNADIRDLTGMGLSTVSKKYNGKRPITERLPKELANISKVISLGGFPADCPEWLRRAIIERRIKMP